MSKYIMMLTIIVFFASPRASANLKNEEFYQKVAHAMGLLNTITTYKQYSDGLAYLRDKVGQGSKYPCPGNFMINPIDYKPLIKSKVDSLPPLAKAIVIACGTMNLEREKIPVDIITKVEEAQQELEKEILRIV